nr:hypothetical protein [Tanacetum cinerariifolium]
EIEQELHTQRDRVAASEGENTALRERVRVMELGNKSLKVSLRTARTGHAEMQHRELSEDDDDVLDKLSLDSRYNVKKVMCGLMYRYGSSDDGNGTNIILQGLPANINSLVNHHIVAKDLWERVQILVQGTTLTKQERECKLYDAFDKFNHIKGGSLHKYYLRFIYLINDMNIYNMKMEQFQVNTKFLNSLPPEWRDDLIACLNKAMNFLTVVASSRVTVQQVQGRQRQSYSGICYKSNAASSGRNNANGYARVVKCYNYQGEMEDIDTYNSDCDDVANAKAVLMANISNYGSDVISKGESVNMERKRNESCDKCFNLYDESCNNQNALEILEFLKNNDLKAQIQDKDTTICKLKEIIKSMREKSKEENVNYDCETETKNVELENSVAKLLLKNERLYLKDQIQDKVFVITPLKNDLQKLKGKDIIEIAAEKPFANTIVPGMFKLDLDPLAPKLLQNKEARIDYLKTTSANIVPPKQTTSHSVETNKQELKFYSRKPINVKNVASSKKDKIAESKNANHSEPNHTWESNATDIISNGKLIYNSIINGPYVRRMIPEPGDQNREIILLGLPEDVYVAVDSCETAQEIWLRVQQMTKGSDIGIQEKKAKLFNEWERFTSIDGESVECYYHRFSKLMNDFKRNKHFLEKMAKIANQNPYGNGNVLAARAEGNAIGNNGNQIRCYNYRGLGNLVRNCTVRPRRRDVAYLQTQLLIAQKEEARIQLQAKEFDLTAAATYLDEIEEVNANYGSAKVHNYDNCYDNEIFNMFTQEEQYTELHEPILEPHQIKRLQAQLGDQKGKSKDTPCVSNTFDPLSQKLENKNVKLEFQVRNYEKENDHLKTTYKNLFDSISATRAQTETIIDLLQDKLHDMIYENAKLRARLFVKVSEQKDTTKGTSMNTQFCKQSILGKPPSSSGSKLYAVTPFPKSKGFPKIDETHALSKPVTSNSYPEIHPPSQEKSDEVFQANHSFQYKENLENSSNPNQEKEEPSQDSDIRQLIREECCVEASEEQKQSMENTILELFEICHQKELLCMHDNVEDLIESALNTKLLLINSNSQRLDKKEQEVKNVVEQQAERRNQSNVENLLPIPSECEVTLEYESKCDVPISKNSPICDDHSDTFFDSKIDDDISVYNDDFEDIEYVKASISDPEIVSVEEKNGVEEENVVQQEEKEVDLEDISQIQDVVLREKLLSITSLISNIESLNNNSTPDCVLNSFESDNSLSDNFSPEFETFCDHSKETRSGNTTHADNSLPEYDLFCFEIEPDQERLIKLVKSNIYDNSSNVSLLEEADLFLASDNSIPPGIENSANDLEGDVCFLEELLINDFILSHESSDSNFEDNPSIPRPPPEPPDAETDAGEEIPVVMNDKDEDVDYSSFIFISVKVFSFLSAKSEDTIFDPSISD